ncbi:MAG: hypothetical protein ACI88H_000836 [Cocleimonas sp.]|jgi:hypothetical protein
MQNHPTQKRRLLLSVIIKLLTFLGLLLLLLVFFNSLFTDDESNSKTAINKIQLSKIEISEMVSGQIRKVRWNGKEAAILLRQFPEKLDQTDTAEMQKEFQEKLHSSIKLNSRSKKAEYFVYINTGDSKNCPLYYAAGIFKDVCSSNKFDEAGRDIKNKLHGYKIEIPPHYFNNNIVVFGQW